MYLEENEQENSEVAKNYLIKDIKLALINGDTDFMKVPINLLEVLLKAGLNYPEFKLYLFILRRTYGFNGLEKKKYFDNISRQWKTIPKNANRIYVNQIEEATGISYKNICRYIRSLAEKKMIYVLEKIRNSGSWVILVKMNWNKFNISEEVKVSQIKKLIEQEKIV